MHPVIGDHRMINDGIIHHNKIECVTEFPLVGLIKYVSYFQKVTWITDSQPDSLWCHMIMLRQRMRSVCAQVQAHLTATVLAFLAK